MYDLTIELNQKCNLMCKYCYLEDKNNKEISFEVGKKTVDFAVACLRKQKDNLLRINFVGGEPLISFYRIKQLVAYARQIDGNIRTKFTITTNALLLDEEILKSLILNEFSLKISLDGSEKINDLNRIDKNGQGTYNALMKKLDLFSEFQIQTGRCIQVNHVVTHNNVEYFSDSLIHLAKMGYKHIDTGFDTYKKWNNTQLKILECELDKAIEYYLEKSKTQEAFYWTFPDRALIKYEKIHKDYFCGAGIVSSYIDMEGNIFPCPKAIQVGYSLGNVQNCIDYSKINTLSQIKIEPSSKCKRCTLKDNCRSWRCIFGNLYITGVYNLCGEFGCWFTQYCYRLEKNYPLLRISVEKNPIKHINLK